MEREQWLTGKQQIIHDAIQSYMSLDVVSSQGTQLPPLVLVKYQKRQAVFRLFDEDDILQCSFCMESVFIDEDGDEDKCILKWTIHELRSPDEHEKKPARLYNILYESVPVIRRPGVSTAIFHTLNRNPVMARTVYIAYRSYSQALSEYQHWIDQSYVDKKEVVSVRVRYSARRGDSQHNFFLTFASGRHESLRIFEDCDVDTVRKAVVSDDPGHRIYVACIDTRSRNDERKHLIELEKEGKVKLLWCEREPTECMDYAECGALLMLLRLDDEPLSQILNELIGRDKNGSIIDTAKTMPRIRRKLSHLHVNK